MDIKIPQELESFVAEQVKAGRFRSPEDMVVAALLQLRAAPDPAIEDDEELWRSFDEAEAELAAGKTVPADEVFAELRAKYLGNR